jgi:hypothetical protein
LPNVGKEIVGDLGLLSCAAMGGGQNCRRCNCSYLKHQHIYYTTKEVEKRVKDDNINTLKEKQREWFVKYKKIYKIGKRKTVDHKNYRKVGSLSQH